MKSCIFISCLQSMDGLTVDTSPVLELSSNQEEADTRVVKSRGSWYTYHTALPVVYSSQQMPTDVAVVVRSPDTDVFILAYSLEIQQPLMCDTRSGNKRRLLAVRKHAAALGHDVACALPTCDAFTGSDCTSAFVKKRKERTAEAVVQQSNCGASIPRGRDTGKCCKWKCSFGARKVCVRYVWQANFQQHQQSAVQNFQVTVWTTDSRENQICSQWCRL